MYILKPKLDIVFKMIFGDERNINIITSFIAALLSIPKDSIKKITIMNVEFPPEEYGQKFERLDLRMEVNINNISEIINIEIQVLSEPNYEERSLLYWSRNFSTQLKTSEPYSLLKKTVCLNIINFNLFKCTEYHSSFTLMERNRHEILTDKIEISFFELKKLKKSIKNIEENYIPTPMENWLNFVNAETEDDLMLLQDKIKDPALNEAIVILKNLSGDERTRELAFQREKRLHDEASALEYAHNEGFTQGITQGIRQGENRLNSLISKLIELNRLDDLKRSTIDAEFRQKLMNELLPPL